MDEVHRQVVDLLRGKERARDRACGWTKLLPSEVTADREERQERQSVEREASGAWSKPPGRRFHALTLRRSHDQTLGRSNALTHYVATLLWQVTTAPQDIDRWIDQQLQNT